MLIIYSHMKLDYEVWDALAKFFISVSQGLILSGIVSYILESKNLGGGIVVVIFGITTLFYGLYLTAVAAVIKQEG